MNKEEAQALIDKYEEDWRGWGSLTEHEAEELCKALALTGEIVDNGDGTYSLPEDVYP
jgi:hypothetical protein